MINEIYTLTEAELNDLIFSAMALSGSVGVVIGFGLALVFIYLINETNSRNLKMHLCTLSANEKAKVNEHIEDLYEVLDALSKTNNRLFRIWYNDVCRLKAYLMLKKYQN